MSAEWNVTYKDEVLDAGRMLLVRVSMGPEATKGEVSVILRDTGRQAPPKGFRPGKVQESVLRRLFGKQAVVKAQESLIAKSRGVVLDALAKKHGFDKESAPAPTNVKFSEDGGLSYEVVIMGQFAATVATTAASTTPAVDKALDDIRAGGSVVDLRARKDPS